MTKDKIAALEQRFLWLKAPDDWAKYPPPNNRLHFACGSGWYDLIWKLCEDLEAMGFDGRVSTIKEKFGGLRFYPEGPMRMDLMPAMSGWVGVPPDAELMKRVLARIGEAEAESYKICEKCGTREQVATRGNAGHHWIVTLCEPCRAYMEAKGGQIDFEEGEEHGW